MLFMNEYEVARATVQWENDPILGPAALTLQNLVDWTNRNSDGWPYWPKPCRAARKLQELLQRGEATVVEYRKALAPIKAFRTRQGADFVIVDPS